MKKIFCLFLMSAFLLSCAKDKTLYRETEFVMDTVVTITFSSKAQKPYIEKAFKILRDLTNKLNAYNSKTEVSEINRQAGIKPVRVSPETYHLIQKAIDISKLTKGAFDITVGAVSFLYDFEKKTIPTYKQIKKHLALVDYRNIQLKDGMIFLKKKGMKIDPGGIAKGYGADLVAEFLKKNGIQHALIAVAGDIKAIGKKPDGSRWKIGIRDPRGAADDIFAIVELPEDWAISTSGDYERYVLKNGKRFHHILNPKTGLPARGLVSVSCIGPSATLTDSLATAVFILGKKEGVKIAESMGYGVVLVDEQGHVYVSPEIKTITKVLYEPKIKLP